jgi:hypothetical protein
MDYTWIGGNGNWYDADNWSPTQIPTSGDNVEIGTSSDHGEIGEPRTVSVNVPDLTITSGGTVAISGHDTGVIALALDNGGTISIDQGFLQMVGGASFYNSGKFIVDGGDIDLPTAFGEFQNIGVISLEDDATAYFGALTTAQLGAVTTSSGGNLSFIDLHNAGAVLDLGSGTEINGVIEGGTIEGVAVVGDLDGGSLDFDDNLTFSGADGVGPGMIILETTGAELIFSGMKTVDNVEIDVGGESGGFPVEIYAGYSQSQPGGNTLTFGATAVINQVGGQFRLQGGVPINNEGLIEVSAAGGVFEIYSFTNFANEGMISVARGATFSVDAGSTFVDAGTISGAGVLALSGDLIFDSGAALSIAGLEENVGAAAVLSIDDSLEYEGFFRQDAQTALRIGVDDMFALSGDSVFAGLTEGAGTLALVGGASEIDANAEIEVANCSISGGATVVTLKEPLTYAGELSLDSGATLNLIVGVPFTLSGHVETSGGIVRGSSNVFVTGTTLASGLTIGGTVIWANEGDAAQDGGGLTIESDAILYNTATGVYDITDDSGVALGAGAASYINNAGLFEKSGGTGTSAIAASLLNSGEIDVSSGTLDLLGQLWGQGRVDVGAGATLQFGAAVGATASATVYVAGALTFASGATLTLAGENLGLEGAADFAGATLEGADRLTTFAATAMSGLAVGGAAVWLNAATVTQSGGDLTLGDSSGGAAIAFNQAIYDIVDDSGVESGAAAAYINNAGLFEKTGGAGTSVVAANMYSAGTIEAASGTLDFQAALWGPGTSKVDAGATLEVDGVVGGASILAFHGSAGAVALDDLYAGGVDLFHGSIQGFAAGDTIDAGAYGIGTSALFTENGAGTGGALTLTNGGATASIAMTGVYKTANFAMASDGHGGTLLTFHA